MSVTDPEKGVPVEGGVYVLKVNSGRVVVTVGGPVIRILGSKVPVVGSGGGSVKAGGENDNASMMCIFEMQSSRMASKRLESWDHFDLGLVFIHSSNKVLIKTVKEG